MTNLLLLLLLLTSSLLLLLLLLFLLLLFLLFLSLPLLLLKLSFLLLPLLLPLLLLLLLLPLPLPLPLPLLLLLLLLAARASAAAPGGAISLLACAETQVLALCSPEIELALCFRIGFLRCFLAKKLQQPAGCTVQKHAQLSISHRFFRWFPVCVSHFASVFTVILSALDFLHMPV